MEEEEKDTFGMPKKPLSSYIFFSQEIREQIRKNNPNMSVHELMKAISLRWQTAKEKEKVPFNELALQDKKRYEDELNQYKNKNKNVKPQRVEKDKDQLFRHRSANDFSLVNKTPNDSFQKRQNSNKFSANAEAPQNLDTGVKKRERRTKKYFDNQFNPAPNNDEFVIPPSNDYFEGRSMSNNRVEDRGTERSKQDSIMFPFNEDDDKECFLNKDSPPDNEYMPFARNQPEQEAVFGEDMNRLSSREGLIRQDSNKFPQMDNAIFTTGNFGAEQNPQRHVFANYRNYDGAPNDSFGAINLSFKGDAMDFSDPGYGRGPNQSFGGNGFNNPMEFKFGSTNQMGNFSRGPQNSFNNPFGDQVRSQMPPDYYSGNINPNMQYTGAVNNQANYYPAPMGQRRPNTYGNNKR
jgi:hypothetical protein